MIKKEDSMNRLVASNVKIRIGIRQDNGTVCICSIQYPDISIPIQNPSPFDIPCNAEESDMILRSYIEEYVMFNIITRATNSVGIGIDYDTAKIINVI